jgi:site-specific DNA recombinase
VSQPLERVSEPSVGAEDQPSCRRRQTGRIARRPLAPVGEGNPMRVAIYTRISTDETHQPYSLEAQAGRLDAYIASQPGWTAVRRFTDQESGAKLDRPALQRALREAHAGRFDLLLVYRVDRLARSVRGLAHILEELDAAGVAFRSATEPFDTATPAGRMMVQMLGVFAEFERATIIDRVLAGMERAAARGGWMGGQAPYGYAIAPEGRQLVVNPEEAPLIPVIFRKYAVNLLGAHAIAAWLTERGHRTRAGRPWGYRMVLTVLRNRAYLGEVNFRGESYQSRHQPLVDEKLFHRAQAILHRRGEDVSTRAANSSDYLLTGLVVCDRCGKHFIGTAATGKLYRYRYYTCFNRSRYGNTACNADRLPADELEQAVLNAMLATYERRDLIDQATRDAWTRAQAGRSSLQAELTVIDGEIDKAETAIDRYLNAFETGQMHETQCGPRLRRHTARLAELRDRKTDLTEQLATRRVPTPTEAQLAQLRRRVREAAMIGPNPERKALIQQFVHEIRVHHREKIIPVFHVPDDDEPHIAGVRAPFREVRRQGLEPRTRGLRDGQVPDR